MKKLTINFLPGESAAAREHAIKSAIEILFFKSDIKQVESAMLQKDGWPDMEYGYGDEDTVFADKIEIRYN